MWNSFRVKAPGAVIAGAILAVSIFLLSGCGGPAIPSSEASNVSGTSASLSKVALEVSTIWCSTCRFRVEASAKSVPGVAEVQFDKQTVIVIYDPTQTTPDAIVEALERGGDRVTKATEL